jgi:hypothetical protein
MDLPVEPIRAMADFLGRWLAEGEVQSWVRACARFAAAGAGPGTAPDPWPAVRAAVAELLEAKRLVDCYHENDQEGPDPFTADLASLLAAIPPGRAGTGPAGGPDLLLLQLYTKELLERCHGRPRRWPERPEDGLEPPLGPAEGVPQRRSL